MKARAATTKTAAFSAFKVDVMLDTATNITATNVSLVRFNDPGTGSTSMLSSGTTKTSPGNVYKWVEYTDTDGTPVYGPLYANKTS
jgi:hypothetical protein